MRKENSAVLIIVAITTILIAFIGVSFAYFISKIQIDQNGAKSSTKINTATMARVEYTSNSDLGSNNIEIKDAIPGKFGYVEFTLNASTKDEEATSYYQIVWNIDENEFKYLNPDTGATCEDNTCEAQIYYALYDGKININKEPFTDPAGQTYEIFKGVTDGNAITYNNQTVKNDITAKTGEIILDIGQLNARKDNPQSKTYKLVVWFEETGHNQINNQGKVLNGKIDVKLSDKKFE